MFIRAVSAFIRVPFVFLGSLGVLAVNSYAFFLYKGNNSKDMIVSELMAKRK